MCNLLSLFCFVCLEQSQVAKAALGILIQLRMTLTRTPPLSLHLLKSKITMSHFNLLYYFKKLGFLDLFTLFLCECILFLHVCMCTTFVLGAQRVLRGNQIPWLSATNWMLEQNRSPLKQQQCSYLLSHLYRP